MFILQTLQEFVNNPMGRGSNAIPSRNLIKDDLNRRFSSLFGVKEKKISLTIYRDKDDYYFHLIIPSESKERKNTYDVVLHFTTEENDELANDNNLKRYGVKFFSNSPSFTYTFAYAFNLYGLLIPQLSDKYRHQIFDKPPITRNPGEIISYEKTTYFAAHYILTENKYMNKLIINSLAKPYSDNVLKKVVRNTDKIELEIKQEKNRVEREKKEREKKEVRKKTVPVIKTVERDRGKVVNNKSRVITPRGKVSPKKSSISKIKPR